jgi:hypothetical protein
MHPELNDERYEADCYRLRFAPTKLSSIPMLRVTGRVNVVLSG